MEKVKKVKTATGTPDEITDTIVAKMWELIKRDVRDTEILKVANSLKKSSRDETLESVFNYVTGRFPYKSDPPGIEHLTAPRHIIRGEAPFMDCDELVIITATLLRALKIPVLIKTIAWRKDVFTHVVLEAQYNEKAWIVLDPTRKDGFGRQIMNVKREKRYKG